MTLLSQLIGQDAVALETAVTTGKSSRRIHVSS
jgi:hypothetical protein